MKNSQIRVNTPIGTLIAKASDDPAHPGEIYITLENGGIEIDVCAASVDKGSGALRAFVWGDATDDGYTHEIDIENVSEAFEAEEAV